MTETEQFGLLLVVAAAAGLAAILSNRLTEKIKVPVPALMLVASAIAVKLVPGLNVAPEQTVERVVTAALVCILFSGGMSIGWRRFREAALPISLVGVAGTFLTAAGGALLMHTAFGFSWYVSILVATAVAPTDPAVVFSVLGNREVEGRSGTILEGESGANDPVGIALMTALLAGGGLTGQAFAQIGLIFVLQMVIGAVIGLLGGKALVWFIRRVPLPSEALYPLRTLAAIFILYGVATVAHGSGFLAVFVAGILVGDARAPYKRETERFHDALGSLGEIIVFVALGLTVSVDEILHLDVWLPGLVLGAVLAFVIRPLLVGLCLIPARLQRNERTFVLFAGLKGAVPILLGEFLRVAHVPGAERLYGIVVVVVVFSVVVQGSLTGSVATWLKLPVHQVEPQPWALGVRLRDEPNGAAEFRVAADSRAEGKTVAELDELGEDAWISLLVRDSELVQLHGDTRLELGDQLLILADSERLQKLTELFDTCPEPVADSVPEYGPRDQSNS